MRERSRRWGVGVVAAFLLGLGGLSAEAATFTVNTTVDAPDASPGDGVCAAASGLCTLRAAVMEANALGGVDTVTLAAGTYALTIPGVAENSGATGDLDVTGALTINGAGAASTIIDGGGLDRVIEIHPGATVQVNGVTIRNGHAAGAGGNGAGGGMFVSGATLTLTGSVVSGNTAAGDGGGILAEGATTALIGSTVSGNVAGAGGGIVNRGSMALHRSTVASNRAVLGDGGGLWNDGGAMSLISSTVSGNVAGASGGGLFVDGAVILTSATVTGNGATSGGGIFNAGTTIVSSTIVAHSSGGNCGGGAVVGPPNSYNLASDGTCAFDNPGDLEGVDPVLGPLADNGGPTPTHAVLPGSPAIDAVPAASCAVSVDQRGVSRPRGAGCEIGAYEIAASAACVAPPSSLVAWWPMEDGPGATSLRDLVGSNDATPLASPVGAAQGPQPAPGMVGGGMRFPKFGDGLSGARVGPQGPLAAVGAAGFTIAAWVQVPAVAPNRVHHVVNKLDTAQNRGYALSVVTPGSVGSARLEFRWADGASAGTVQTPAVLTAGQWHHVAVTFARSFGLDVRLYVDGVQQGQQSVNPPGPGSLVNSVALEIGQQPSPLDEPITIDELEIFNVALSLSDVRALVDARTAGRCKCATGGQSVDLSVDLGAGFGLGVGAGVAATVSNPVTVSYSVHGCLNRELFLIVSAPGLPQPLYFDGSAWLPAPALLSQITPFVSGGPATTDGSHALFSGDLAPGTYDVFLVCDLFANGRLNATFPPVCLLGAFDHLPLTVR